MTKAEQISFMKRYFREVLIPEVRNQMERARARDRMFLAAFGIKEKK